MIYYQKEKIIYHLDLPYREMCNSDYYSIHTKYRGKVIYEKLRKDVEEILRELCEQKDE